METLPNTILTTYWWRHRAIPASRDQINRLLENLKPEMLAGYAEEVRAILAKNPNIPERRIDAIVAQVACRAETLSLFAEAKPRVIEDVPYEARLRAVVERGEADVAAGRVIEGTDAVIARMYEVWGER